jgi:hypothetical protein
MKSAFAVAIGLFALAGTASAQTSQPQTAAAPPAGPTHPAGRYWGTDTDGHRVDVQAPMGGKSQAEADKIEAGITERLNEQALVAARPH